MGGAAYLWAVTGNVDPPQSAAARQLLRDQFPQHDPEAIDVDLRRQQNDIGKFLARSHFPRRTSLRNTRNALR